MPLTQETTTVTTTKATESVKETEAPTEAEVKKTENEATEAVKKENYFQKKTCEREGFCSPSLSQVLSVIQYNLIFLYCLI